MGGAGSTTAAQFLERFIINKPLGHLDIAGMAFPNMPVRYSSGATGYGVRLLNL